MDSQELVREAYILLLMMDGEEWRARGTFAGQSVLGYLRGALMELMENEDMEEVQTSAEAEAVRRKWGA